MSTSAAIVMTASPAQAREAVVGGAEVLTQDGFLIDPELARRDALSSEFIDWPGHDGQVYKRVCLKPVPGLQEAIEAVFGPVDMFAQGYRLNFGGELPNQSIHSDLGWGTHAAVVYLSEGPEGPGGTAFWRHNASGADRIKVGDHALFEQIGDDWEREEAWQMTGMAELAFNRGVLYNNSLFHSRYPFEAFGSDEQNGRLIAVAFFTPGSAS